MPDPSSWLLRLTTLKVGAGPTGKPAPHKPLLLLCVLDMIDASELADSAVRFDVRLTQRFRDYWSLVAARQPNAPDIALPFHHLGSDGVWQTCNGDGAPSTAKATTRLCIVDPDLWQQLSDPTFRLAVRRTLIARYFEPLEQAGLCARHGLPLPSSAERSQTAADADAWKAIQKKGRDGRFKAEVLAGYQYVCALTGYRLMTETGAIVQAAHIEQHARTGNDDPRNGLALTPDAHWMFDNGLWTVRVDGDRLLVEVKLGNFEENDGRLQARHRQLLFLHEHARLRPKVEYLRWHARHWGFGE